MRQILLFAIALLTFSSCSRTPISVITAPEDLLQGTWRYSKAVYRPAGANSYNTNVLAYYQDYDVRFDGDEMCIYDTQTDQKLIGYYDIILLTEEFYDADGDFQRTNSYQLKATLYDDVTGAPQDICWEDLLLTRNNNKFWEHFNDGSYKYKMYKL